MGPGWAGCAFDLQGRICWCSRHPSAIRDCRDLEGHDYYGEGNFGVIGQILCPWGGAEVPRGSVTGYTNVRDERGQVCVEWWESFFDEHYVQAWTAAGSFTDTDTVVDDVDALLGLPPGAEILDIACGFGRVAGPLSKRGYRVTGIDFSPEQLQLAEQRNPGPTYLEADMRRPPPGPFDAAINLFSSFGYFDDPRDDAAAVTAWATCLRPGGILVMELMHRDRVAHLYGQPIEHPGGVSETGHTDWVTGMRTSTMTYGSIVKTFRFRLYTVTELVQLLHQAGFGHVDAYGALRGGEVSPESRLALRAVK